mgnify:FL=1
MLRMAKKNAPNSLKVKFEIGDAESLDYSNETFDCIVSARFLNWLPPKIYYKVLDEFIRISKNQLLIQVRLKDKVKVSKILGTLIKNISLRKIKKIIIRILFRKNIYKDYFVHPKKDTMDYLKMNFKNISIKEIDTRYKYSKFEKHTFYLIHCSKK